MKKIFYTTFAAILAALCLASCAKPIDQDVDNSPTKAPSSTTELPTNELTDAPTEIPTNEPTEEPVDEAPRIDALATGKHTYDFETVTITLPDPDNEADLGTKAGVQPFTVSMLLPSGWTFKTTRKPDVIHMAVYDSTPFLLSKLWIYDENGICMGAFGYDTYEFDDAHPEEKFKDDARYIYSDEYDIGMYSFDTWFYYSPLEIDESKANITGITRVICRNTYYDTFMETAGSACEPHLEDLYFPTIVSHDPDTKLRLYFVFENDAFSLEQFMKAAESITMDYPKA